jgi:hypothetical protein
VDVFEQHQDRLLPRQCFELVEQGCQGQPSLLHGAQCERRIALAGRDRQEGSKERCGFRDARRRQYGFELVELRLGRVLGDEAGGTPQLHDKGVQDAVAVIGRALIAQPGVGLVRDLGCELSTEPRLADAGLAREQHDLAGAGPGLSQAVAQHRTLCRPPDEVGEPATRRLKAAFRHGDVFDHECLDRLGEALDRLPAEVAQPEQVADQAAGGAGEDDLPGFRKSLQARREVGGLARDRLLLRRALADHIADDDKPGGDADADGEPLLAMGHQSRHCRFYFQPGPHRPLGVVLMRPRITEIGQHPVTHVFRDEPVIARDDAGNGVLIGADLLAQFLGVEPHRQGRRADEITKHHRQLPPLGLWGRRCVGDCRGHIRGERRGAQCRDGVQQLAPVPDRCNANFPKVLRCQLGEHLPIDLVVAKGGYITLKAQTLQPRRYVHAVILCSRKRGSSTCFKITPWCKIWRPNVRIMIPGSARARRDGACAEEAIG